MNDTSMYDADVRPSTRRWPSPAVGCLVDGLLRRYDRAVLAVLFYGSCLRTGDDLDGLVDLYVIVDDYRYVHDSALKATLNRLLPPSVFYLELPFGEKKVRCKYAVLSMADLRKGTSPRWFHSYLWGRFCQPTALVYWRDASTRVQVDRAMARAVVTFLTRVVPCLPPRFTIRELWCKGLELSYRAEVRPERPDQQARLFDAAPDYFTVVTHQALDAVPHPIQIVDNRHPILYRAAITESVRCAARLAWYLRRLQGKILSALRLIKGATTFEGGVDYLLWKIERHSGVTIEVAPRLKRHLLPAMVVLSWRMVRRRAIR
jgi:hypothetical protein